MRIAIGIPCNRQFKSKTVLSLMEMTAYSKYELEIIISTEGFNTAENRMYIATQAIKKGCTHLLLTDDDMVYEKDTLEKLVAHKKDIVGVAGNVRRLPPSLVIEYLDDEKSETEIFKCKAIGGAMLLIDLKVFHIIKKPWFWYELKDDSMVSMSNDWWFCRQARNAGFDIWCDPTITLKHIGDYEF